MAGKILERSTLRNEVPLCCGCASCANACPTDAIRMSTEEAGFYKPLIDSDACIGCHLCLKTCPVLNEKKVSPFAFKETGDKPKVVTAWHKDESIRLQSSSGGVFTALAHCIIENEGLVYGVAWDEKLRTQFIRVSDIEGLSRLRGSKYSQPDVDFIFRQVKADLKNGKEVLFAGTACQIAGLKSYLNKSKTANLYTAEIICHGMPSPTFFQSYLDYMCKQHKDSPRDIHFRDKTHGWRMPHINFLFPEKNVLIRSSFSKYMLAFMEHYSMIESCYNCPHRGYERVGDLTLGDSWAIHVLHPDIDSTSGISHVLINSMQGHQLLSKAEKYLHLIEESESDFATGNPNLLVSPSRHPKRDHFMRDVIAGVSYQKITNKYLPFYRVYGEKILRKLRPLLRRFLRR